MRGSFLWRNRVLLTSGALLILSLHLISTGVHPGDLAARPASVFLAIIRPIDAGFKHLSSGASAIVNDYLALVHVREEMLIFVSSLPGSKAIARAWPNSRLRIAT